MPGEVMLQWNSTKAWNEENDAYRRDRPGFPQHALVFAAWRSASLPAIEFNATSLLRLRLTLHNETRATAVLSFTDPGTGKAVRVA